MTLLKKILLFLVLISLSATGIMYLLEPIDSLENNLSIYNNSLTSEMEIKNIIINNFDDQQAFIKYNPLNFSEKIEEHPLIKDTVIRTNIFAANKFTIIITEEKPWAIFRNKIYNHDFKAIIDFDSKNNQNDFESIQDLYSSALSGTNKVLQIKSNHDLELKDFKKLKKITEKINERFEIINQDKINKLSILDGDLSLRNPNLKLILGSYQSKVKKRIKKLDHMLSKIKTNITEIEYIDLSLDTDEAIIGKRL